MPNVQCSFYNLGNVNANAPNLAFMAKIAIFCDLELSN